jgi:hypothetical protein
MFSVIRFSGSNSVLRELGIQMNSSKPGVFEEISKRGDHFSIEVSDSVDWADHRKAAMELISTLEADIQERDPSLIRICLDVACEPSDYQSHLLKEIHLDSDLLCYLYRNKISLSISIYSGLDIKADKTGHVSSTD